MPQRKNAIKALRQNHKRHLHNLDIKTDLRKTVKNFLKAVENKDKTDAQGKLKVLFKKIDKATKRNLLHKNTASRRKSRFARLMANIA